MMRRKTKSLFGRARRSRKRPARPLLTTWPIRPDVPTNDLLARRNLDDPGDVDWAFNDFITELETGYFLQWEAVISQEQGLPLTRQQQAALSELIFWDDEADEILYIDEIPRPKEAWYVIARRLAAYMLKQPYHTDEVMYSVYGIDGWPRLVSAISQHAQHLSLPVGIEDSLDIFPVRLKHLLWLQACFEELYGLGQEEELTLANEGQQSRVSGFIRDLRDHKDTVSYFELTLDSLLEYVILPERDRALFVTMMMEQLGLPSSQAALADYL
jgi:hypothetical protein